MKRTNQVPVVLTSFAFREEYFPELNRMIATARRHHPDWFIVTGKGPLPGCELPTLDVESPAGRQQWSLPVLLNLDGSGDDWRKITKMKAWWISRVWHTFGHLTGEFKRLLWINADAQINGPLDIELSLESEIVAGAAWRDARYPDYGTISSGLLLFQGASRGATETILNHWSDKCLSHIQKLPEPPLVPWGDSDREVLNQLLRVRPVTNGYYILNCLDAEKYCGLVNKDGRPVPGILVNQYAMTGKRRSGQKEYAAAC